jgi:hypothetical protein
VLTLSQFDLVVHVNYVLLDYMKNYDPDMEIQFASLLPLIALNIGSDKYAIYNSTLKVIKSYLKISRNLEAVLNALNREAINHTLPSIR